MIIKILFILSNIWYWTAEGVTEGFTWSSDLRRMNNKLIRGGQSDSSYLNGKGIFCYHTWRAFGENVGIFAMTIFAFLLFKISFGNFILLLSGATLISIFVYERFFNYISYNKLFPQKNNWDVLNGLIIIPRAPWQDWIFLGIGIIFIIFGLI